MRELRANGVVLTETMPGPGGGEDVRPEALPLLIAELRESRQANVPAGRLVNEAVAIIRLFRARPPSVPASVGLVGLYVAICALTVAGALVVLHLSVGDVWNLRARVAGTPGASGACAGHASTGRRGAVGRRGSGSERASDANGE